MPTTTSALLLLRGRLMSNSDVPEECWELIARYRGELLNQAFALLGNAEDAEDVVQETFADAFRDRARIANLESIGAWLRSLNRDNALTRLRLRRAAVVKTERKNSRCLAAWRPREDSACWNCGNRWRRPSKRCPSSTAPSWLRRLPSNLHVERSKIQLGRETVSKA